MASDTSTVVKSGDILIEVTKILAKSWQQRFCVLHRKTDKGHADLCMYDSRDDFHNKPKKPYKKIVLENVKYIHKSTKQSKENTEYLLEFKSGRERQILKFTTPEDLNDWELHLKDSVDICTDGSEERSSTSVNDDSASDGVFTDNVMYNTTEPAFSYEVKIDENDTAKKCHLKGDYNIHISSTGIGLLDNKQNVVYSWPYNFIRRWGVEQKCVFVVEVGRKCNSGGGQFRFQTRKAQEINDLVQGRASHMQKTQNPMAIVASLILPKVTKPEGPSVVEDSEGSPQPPKNDPSSVFSSRNSTQNKRLGSTSNNNEAEKQRNSGKKSPDVIPQVHVIDKVSGNGYEGDRRSVPYSPASHNLSHVPPNFQKELEEILNKGDHKSLEVKPENSAVQQIVEDEPSDKNKLKTRKNGERESDKKKKEKEGEKENSKKWSFFKKNKENDKSKLSDRDVKSDRTKSGQTPQHLVSNKSSRFYEEVDITEPVVDTQSTRLYSEPSELPIGKKKLASTKSDDGKILPPVTKKAQDIYSEPFEHTKNKKKSNDGKNPPPVTKRPQDLYSEPFTETNPQNMYPSGVKPGESGDIGVYAEANKNWQDAWKTCGEADKFHDEDYTNIQAAREMQQQTTNEPPLPPRPSSFDDDDDDDGNYSGVCIYNKLDFDKKSSNMKSKSDSECHIYGKSSGPVGPLPEQNYDSVSTGEEEEEEEEGQYAEAQYAYEDAQTPRPKNFLEKSEETHPPESLYEDIKTYN